MSVEGLVNNLKTLKTLGNPGIKHLKLGKLFYGTHEHFEELKSLLHFITMACNVCIARCVHYGRCIKDCEYMETFCLEYLCSGCWKHPLQCPESLEK